MRIYLSGPMTGQEDLNRKAFADVADELRKEGHFVINPHNFTPLFGDEFTVGDAFKELYFVEDMGVTFCPSRELVKRSNVARCVLDAELAALRSCDAIYLLRGWENSRGARKELAESIAHGLSIISEGSEA